MSLSGIISSAAVPVIYGGVSSLFGAAAGWAARRAFEIQIPIPSAALAAGIANGSCAATFVLASKINDIYKLKLENKHLGIISFVGFTVGILAAPLFVPHLNKISSAAFAVIGAAFTIGVFSLVK